MKLRLLFLLAGIIAVTALHAQRMIMLEQPSNPAARKIVILDHTKVKVVTLGGKHYKGELTNIREGSFNVGNHSVRTDELKKFGFSQGKKGKGGTHFKMLKVAGGSWRISTMKAEQ